MKNLNPSLQKGFEEQEVKTKVSYGFFVVDVLIGEDKDERRDRKYKGRRNDKDYRRRKNEKGKKSCYVAKERTKSESKSNDDEDFCILL